MTDSDSLVWSLGVLLVVLASLHGLALWQDRGRRAGGVLVLSLVLEFAAAALVAAFLRGP